MFLSVDSGIFRTCCLPSSISAHCLVLDQPRTRRKAQPQAQVRVSMHTNPPQTRTRFLPSKASLYHSPFHSPLIHRAHPSPSLRQKKEGAEKTYEQRQQKEEKAIHSIRKREKVCCWPQTGSSVSWEMKGEHHRKGEMNIGDDR